MASATIISSSSVPGRSPAGVHVERLTARGFVRALSIPLLFQSENPIGSPRSSVSARARPCSSRPEIYWSPES